jgi:hypothetical protein
LSGWIRHDLNKSDIKNIHREYQGSLIMMGPDIHNQQDSRRYETWKIQKNKIEQVILTKAFLGELAEADPNDEPAEELLKRILGEKGAKMREVFYVR